MKIKLSLSLMGCFYLLSCAAPLTRGVQVIETNEQEVVQCNYIGLVKKHTFFGGLTSESARNDYLSQAASMGATHVVFKKTVSGSLTGVNLYKCMEPVPVYEAPRPEIKPPPTYTKPTNSTLDYDRNGYKRY